MTVQSCLVESIEMNGTRLVGEPFCRSLLKRLRMSTTPSLMRANLTWFTFFSSLINWSDLLYDITAKNNSTGPSCLTSNWPNWIVAYEINFWKIELEFSSVEGRTDFWSAASRRLFIVLTTGSSETLSILFLNTKRASRCTSRDEGVAGRVSRALDAINCWCFSPRRRCCWVAFTLALIYLSVGVSHKMPLTNVLAVGSSYVMHQPNSLRLCSVTLQTFNIQRPTSQLSIILVF